MSVDRNFNLNMCIKGDEIRSVSAGTVCDFEHQMQFFKKIGHQDERFLDDELLTISGGWLGHDNNQWWAVGTLGKCRLTQR